LHSWVDARHGWPHELLCGGVVAGVLCDRFELVLEILELLPGDSRGGIVSLKALTRRAMAILAISDLFFQIASETYRGDEKGRKRGLHCEFYATGFHSL
jgi:hypothetical protein